MPTLWFFETWLLLYCRCNWDTICSYSFNFNITFLNVDSRQGRDNKPRNRKFALLRGKTERFRLACFMACLRILLCSWLWHFIRSILLREFRTSGYNSEWFVIVSCGMPVDIFALPNILSSRAQGLYKHDLNTSHRFVLKLHPCGPSFRRIE